MSTRINDGAPAESDLVLSTFDECSEVRDALVDLRDAGFGEEHIQVAYASECKKVSKMDHSRASEHSFFWKLRRTWEHDLQRKGVDQMFGEDTEPNPDLLGMPHSEVALYKTLEALGVGADRIILLSGHIEPNGALLLVKAKGRKSEVEGILERDSGSIQGDIIPVATPKT